ncbi:MAG: MmgE/PrpD family protein [Pseudomonadales bacterium]
MKQPTRALAERIAAARYGQLPDTARTVGRQALLDYLGVTIAGAEEPLSRILREQALEEGGNPQAQLIARPERVSVRQAALINGAAGHAHDYDDVHDAMIGHPTVPVAPAVLALAERLGSPGTALLTALCAGIDAECAVGRYVGASHYAKGWHATGTVGTFGATAAAAVLLGLDADQTATALGIAGTQAAGLKSQFGTMCKPLHAGHAAATGVEAALLAARGFSSRPDILETAQGFGATQSEAPSAERLLAALEAPSLVPDICFKYHAACYLTHSAIEAARSLRLTHQLQAQDVQSVTVQVNEGHFGVCNIQAPTTGLEAKFSLRFTVAMALAGEDTSSIARFDDALVRQPLLVTLRDKVTVVAHPRPRPETVVQITTSDGRVLSEEANVAIPLRDLDDQWRRLTGKFRTLVTPLYGANATQLLIDACAGVDTLASGVELSRLLAAPTERQEARRA